MPDHRRPQVGDILVGDVEPGVAEPIDGLAEQPGVEGGHTVDDQAEAQGLGGLVGELAVTDVAVVSEVDRVAQALEGLALVELASDRFAQFGVLEVAEDEQCLGAPVGGPRCRRRGWRPKGGATPPLGRAEDGERHATEFRDCRHEPRSAAPR